MSKKLLLIFTGSMLTTFVLGWQAARQANNKDELDNIAQAIPVIRFIRLDKARKALIIGLFNPGKLPLEVSRTELIYEMDHAIDAPDSYVKEYGDKPLVLDPGDTILVPLTKQLVPLAASEAGSYRAQVDFRIPGRIYLFSLRHRFNERGFGRIDYSADS